MKSKLFLLSLILFLFLLYPYLNPFDNKFFDYHDQTQPSRVKEFALSLKNLKIPPRIAPDFYFKMGYPVFNFYSPTAYWLAGGFALLGFNPASSIELSFVILLFIGFLGMYKLTSIFTKKFYSLLAATVYLTSPYIAVEIFVRGNLAELSTWAILPWVIWAIWEEKIIKTAIFFSLLLTSHNILGFSSVLFVLTAALLRRNKKVFFSLFLGVLMSSYFLLPFFLEQNKVWAKEIAQRTIYKEHFLCLKQLWHSDAWLYGASIPGCKDSMSFKLGKLQILIFATALIGFIRSYKKQRARKFALAIFLLSTVFTFLTLKESAFIWQIFEPYSKVIQFPWRFLIFSLFGLSFFTIFLKEFLSILKLPSAGKKAIAVSLILLFFLINKKYFRKDLKIKSEFFEKYLSENYITLQVVRHIPEYISKEADYKKVLSYLEKIKKAEDKEKFRIKNVVEAKNITILKQEDREFEKKAEVFARENTIASLKLHFSPNWEILLDEKPVSANEFDFLGRPQFKLSSGKHLVKIVYKQSPIQKIGNLLTVIGLISLGIYAVYLKKI